MKTIMAAMMAAALLAGTAEAAPVERAATKAEIEKLAIGHTVSGSMRYMPNGRYTYNGGSPGTYKILAGQVCVAFDRGGRRCDKIVTSDGKTFTLINAQGKRFPYRN
ncbi:hypothetical protein BJF93_14615 [Xaviernesmea oryzae]|uniref:Uncharacterized protein n=1 Tax=Xaviernesmea oryzae TaxID=464029 RepID=A0A1Q9AXP5_9HYPH|nr:hypothetical protein [Xaviernesmea oryzae]OLP60200.1 hypothetical protein BJF93_14615 [Xaviernesmea oryzae]SEK28881.1 hypothetical protein SAMN04487976_101297 [Xaviernesmea oryzae]